MHLFTRIRTSTSLTYVKNRVIFLLKNKINDFCVKIVLRFIFAFVFTKFNSIPDPGGSNFVSNTRYVA